jgi:hypothetical protein
VFLILSSRARCAVNRKEDEMASHKERDFTEIEQFAWSVFDDAESSDSDALTAAALLVNLHLGIEITTLTDKLVKL